MEEFIKLIEQKYPVGYLFNCRSCILICQDLREACRHLKQLIADKHELEQLIDEIQEEL